MKKTSIIGVLICSMLLVGCSNNKKHDNATTKTSQTLNSSKKTSASESSEQVTEHANAESSSESDIDIPAIENHDYSSLNGSWINSHGDQLSIKDGTISTATVGNGKTYSLVYHGTSKNVTILQFSPGPLPNGMYLMIALKGNKVQNNSSTDGTDISKDRIMMGNNGGTDLFASKENGGIADTAYYKAK